MRFKLSQYENQIHDLQSYVTCLEIDLSTKTKQCQEIKEDVAKLNDENSRLKINGSLPCSPQVSISKKMSSLRNWKFDGFGELIQEFKIETTHESPQLEFLKPSNLHFSNLFINKLI